MAQETDGDEASLIDLGLLGVDQLLGYTGDEIVFKSEVSNFVLIMLVEQVDELVSDLIELGLLEGGLLALVGLGDSLGLRAHTSLASEAADRFVIEVSVILDRLLVEAWEIWIGCFDLDDGILVFDLALVLGLDFLGWCIFGVGPRWGGLHLSRLFVDATLDFLPDQLVDMVDSGVSCG